MEEEEAAARKKEEKEKNLRKQLEDLRVFQQAAGVLFSSNKNPSSDMLDMYAIEKARKKAFVENRVNQFMFTVILCV